MNRQNPLLSIVAVVVVPAVVSLVVTLIVLRFSDSRQASSQQVIMLPTHSATALIPPREEGAPPPVLEGSGDGGEPGNNADDETPSGETACENPVHVIESGQTLGIIANIYDVSIADISDYNRSLDPGFNPDFLSVGQELVIPECGIPTSTPTIEATMTFLPTRDLTTLGTPGLFPTEAAAGSVAVRIAGVVNPGDITTEAVEIVNQAGAVDLEGWRLSDGQRLSFEFPTFRLFPDGSVMVLTGVGENTPTELYWGRSEPAWTPGDVIFLYDDRGDIQDFFEILE